MIMPDLFVLHEVANFTPTRAVINDSISGQLDQFASSTTTTKHRRSKPTSIAWRTMLIWLHFNASKQATVQDRRQQHRARKADDEDRAQTTFYFFRMTGDVLTIRLQRLRTPIRNNVNVL
uniref:Uncharacterized protein n=1 Tax=Schistocephalus solidus TaxID=70667 RepID=A0A0X3P3L7_SCHSO